MHQALLITEILYKIFECTCEETIHQDIVVSDAARSARVCKAWKDPALDIVWETIISVHNIFRLLFNVSRMAKWSDYLREEDMPSPASWKIFNEYARRIKHLRAVAISDLDQRIILGCLANRPFGERANPVFPHLQTFTANILDARLQMIAMKFISQTVTVLELVEVSMPWSHVVSRPMSIPGVTTRPKPNPVAKMDFAKLLKKLLAKVESIKRLTLSTARLSDFWSLLEATPELESLHWNKISKEDKGPDTLIAHTPLPKLQEFHGWGMDAVELSTVLLLLSDSKLRTLKLFINLDPSKHPDDVYTMKTIADSGSSLESLNLSLHCRHALPFESIAPLSSCSRLKSLHIYYDLNFGGSLHISNLELDTFLSGLPELVTLCIHTELCRSAPIPSLTLGSLRSLVRHCRNLRTLRISVDARQPNFLESATLEPLENPLEPLPTLNFIAFNSSPVYRTHIKSIAHFLRSLSDRPLFLDRTKRFVGYSEGWRNVDVWCEIDDLLRAPTKGPDE